MNDVTKLAFSAARASMEAWVDAGAAFATIAMRLPVVVANPGGREARRMIAEKVQATSQGALAASFALGALALAPPLTPAGLARGALKVATAAATPARKKVRANAKRLTRRK